MATATAKPQSFPTIEQVSELRTYLAANIAVAEADNLHDKAEKFREFTTTLNNLVDAASIPLVSESFEL